MRKCPYATAVLWLVVAASCLGLAAPGAASAAHRRAAAVRRAEHRYAEKRALGRLRPRKARAARASVFGPALTAGGPLARAAAAQNPDGTFDETVGGNANTWTNYTNAGGSQGPTIPAFATVRIACVVQGFRVADGNTAWYQIASAPWSYAYFVSADAFYNNGQTSGSLHGTPFV